MIDANEAIDKNTTKLSDIATFMLDCGLMHTFKTAYPDADLPATHRDGSECIDHIFISPCLATSIRQCGALPIHEGFCTADHRLIYCDLDLNEYFERILRSSRIQVWDKYKQKLRDLYNYHRIFPKALQYTHLINTSKSDDIKKGWILRFDDLNLFRICLQLLAEKQAGALPPHKDPFSETILIARKVRNYWQNRLRKINIE